MCKGLKVKLIFLFIPLILGVSCKTLPEAGQEGSEFLSTPNFVKPAVVFSVGSKVVESGMPLPFKQYQNINKIQSKIRISGEASIGGEFEFRTMPSDNNAIIIDILVNVSLNADTRSSPTTGIGRDVVVYSSGIVHGRAIKRLVVSPSGARTEPTYFEDLNGSLVLRGVGAGGLLAGLKRKVARQEFQKKKTGEIEKIKRELKDEIKKELDLKIDEAVAEINKEFVPILTNAANKAGINSAKLEMSSDNNGLKLALVANEKISSSITDHELMDSAKEKVFVQANDQFLERFLNEMLSDKTLKASEFISYLDNIPVEGFALGGKEQNLNIENKQVSLDPKKIVIKFPANPVNINLDNNEMAISVKGSLSFEGGVAFDRRDYTVKYKIHQRRGAPYLERIGVEVELDSVEGENANNSGLSLKNIGIAAFNKIGKSISNKASSEIQNVMEEFFEKRVDLPRNIPLYRTDMEDAKNTKRSGFLQPRDIRSDNGWIDIIYGYSKIRNDVAIADNISPNDQTENESSGDVCIITGPTKEYCHPRVSPENCQKWGEAAGNYRARFIAGGRCFKVYPEKNIPDNSERGACLLESTKSSKQYCKNNYSYGACVKWGEMSTQWSSRFTIYEECKKEYPELNN